MWGDLYSGPRNICVHKCSNSPYLHQISTLIIKSKTEKKSFLIERFLYYISIQKRDSRIDLIFRKELNSICIVVQCDTVCEFHLRHTFFLKKREMKNYHKNRKIMKFFEFVTEKTFLVQNYFLFLYRVAELLKKISAFSCF